MHNFSLLQKDIIFPFHLRTPHTLYMYMQLHVYVHVHVVFLTLLVEIILAKFLSLLRNGLYLVCIPGFVSEPSPGDRLRPPPAEEEEA